MMLSCMGHLPSKFALLQPYFWAVRIAQYATMGVVGLAYRKGFLPFELFRWLMDHVYAAPNQFIKTGDGWIHAFYCWFILFSEGLLN